MALTLLTIGTPSTQTQQTRSTLQLVTYLYINPGKNADFEEINRARNTRMAKTDVTFRTRISIIEGHPAVYRSAILGLTNMAALDTRRSQLDTMLPDRGTTLGIIDHIDSEIGRSRPDLGCHRFHSDHSKQRLQHWHRRSGKRSKRHLHRRDPLTETPVRQRREDLAWAPAESS